LNVIPIHLPPLRERTEDIPLLVETFIKQIVDKKKLPRNPVLNPETMKILLEYRWPGNIRELENLMEQLLILVDREEIMPEDLPDKFKDGTRHTTRRFMKYQDAKESFEKEYFVQLLNRYKWNITKAADEANMSRRNLHEKIRNLDIIAPWEQAASDERHPSDGEHHGDDKHTSNGKVTR
jgi:DNA-binding NtrC family response regulator